MTQSIIPRLQKIQKDKAIIPQSPSSRSKIGFAFSTKDRIDFSEQTLKSMEQDQGYDIIWNDGSTSPEGKNYPYQYKLKSQKLNIKEINYNITGGPDNAICFGLKRLLDLGYDYCGLIENDIIFKKGWFKFLISVFEQAKKDNIALGAATVRSYQKRVIEFKNGYSLNWNIGAGMILLTRLATQIILDNYSRLPKYAYTLYGRFARTAGIDLFHSKVACNGKLNCRLSCDWTWDLILWEHGLPTASSIPSYINIDLGFDNSKVEYVNKEHNHIGLNYPLIKTKSLIWLIATTPFINIASKLYTKIIKK